MMRTTPSLFDVNRFWKGFNEYKNYKVDNKQHDFFKLFRNEIPEAFEKVLKEKQFKNQDYISIKASTGTGRISDSFWIAFLDNRLTTKGKRVSTQVGIYIVLLFSESGDNFYLSIATGTENFNLTEIREQAKAGKQFFARQIQSNEKLLGFNTDEFYLGTSARPKKYAASALINKKFNLFTFDEEQLLNDLFILNELFYDYVYEHYLEENKGETEQENLIKKKTIRRKVINVEKYRLLRKEKEIANELTGKAAEEFVFHKEKDYLIREGRNELAQKVDWISNREDGHGYDIKSYFPDGSDKFIEVKGTKFKNNDYQFYLSERERVVAEEKGKEYVLTLVENVRNPRLIKIIKEVRDPIHKMCLKPLNYSGKLKPEGFQDNDE
ncbi:MULTISPECIES: MrcB family domain-containing protein [Bacillus]|uniref:MrcB family domain-containing protein n=1 Tax=Bacillus TaxID=1386 RepID=UPI00117867BC|nr:MULTISPECIES: DUF3578 domain-containing protein [Bacillus]MBR8693033.1 hypothetical protein [Bacillus velezensis]MDM5217058.1 DUF3578 domain-containing protein [Bacillus velezensis]QHC11933.1 DUF3578 domain-containing protein [Bacillus velezensis]TRW30771.1 DUF3578 domain-containing protein [Bacillus sp. PW192]WBS11169.1 DUF3578 domain-containing protein [Bacillus velezensis]